MSSTYSLYKEITTPKRAGDYKSTLAVRYFIETLARDACQAQWNASPYCRILLEARETCDTIHSNIELVSQGKDEIARWNAFDHFVYDLDRLEGSLRDLFVAVDQENEIFEQLKGITLDDTEGLKTLMGLLEDLIDHVWKGDSLYVHNAFTRSLRRIYFSTSDWVNTIRITVTRTQHVSESIQTTLRHLERMVEHIPTWDTFLESGREPTDSESETARSWIRLAASRAIFIHATLWLVKKKFPDLAERDLAEIKRISKLLMETEEASYSWKVAGDYLLWIRTLTFQRPPGTTNDGGPEAPGFYHHMNLPQNIRVPPSYLSLKARVPEIKRPYFSQAVMAVRICEALVMKLGALENQHDAAQLLETTFQLVQAALDKAAGAKKKQDQGITSEISENIAASFERAQKSLEKCFVSFQINEQWATWQGRIQTSKARDEDRSSALEGCLEKSSSFHRENPFKEDEKVEIDLTVKDSWEVIYSRKVTYNISTSSQLGCLLSMEASRERTHYERISSMKTFFTSMAGQRYDLHTKISDIPPNDLKVRSLTLMLCD